MRQRDSFFVGDKREECDGCSFLWRWPHWSFRPKYPPCFWASKSRFKGRTNQSTKVNLDFISWGVHKQTYMDNTLAGAKPIPLLSFGTVNKYGREGITPAGIAKGKGDRLLIDIAQALDRFGRFAYVRPYSEMNGHWNPYCAYNSNGTYRGRAHSTKKF